MNERVSNAEELGRRAVACKHWRWMPGMLATDGWCMHRVISHVHGFDYVTSARYESDGCVSQSGPRADSLMPNLSDPATLGCLLHLVREAYSDELIFTVYDSGYWFVENQHGLMAQKNTEAEALVRVLESAP